MEPVRSCGDRREPSAAQLEAMSAARTAELASCGGVTRERRGNEQTASMHSPHEPRRIVLAAA
jgi:hypothetical protein